MNYKFQAGARTKNKTELRYIKTIKVYWEEVLLVKKPVMTLDELLYAMREQSQWMPDPGVLHFGINDQIGCVQAIRTEDNEVLLTMYAKRVKE